jgi:hypothetical protein
MYFGGIWGGQLENRTSGSFVAGSTTDRHQYDQPALMAKVARLTPDMKQFAKPPEDAVILGEDSNRCLVAIMIAASSKLPGCSSETVPTTSPIRRATPTFSRMRSESRLRPLPVQRAFPASRAGLDNASLHHGMGWQVVALLCKTRSSQTRTTCATSR